MVYGELVFFENRGRVLVLNSIFSGFYTGSIWFRASGFRTCRGSQVRDLRGFRGLGASGRGILKFWNLGLRG